MKPRSGRPGLRATLAERFRMKERHLATQYRRMGVPEDQIPPYAAIAEALEAGKSVTVRGWQLARALLDIGADASRVDDDASYVVEPGGSFRPTS